MTEITQTEKLGVIGVNAVTGINGSTTREWPSMTRNSIQSEGKTTVNRKGHSGNI